MEIYAESALHNTDVLPYGEDTFQIVDEALGGVIAYCHSGSADRIVAALKAHDGVIEATNLGMLIDVLTGCDPDSEVLLDYGGTLAKPGKPTYYRSYHNELALTPDGTETKTVGQVLDILREVRIYGFTRPGMETSAPDHTGIWVANRREPSGLRVSGVRREANRVIIVTVER